MEIELKLLVDGVGADALRNHPLMKKYQTAPPCDHITTSVYFDTPDLQVRSTDAGLRVRHANQQWLQTLKGGGDVSGGLHSRNEWESVVAEPIPDLAALRRLVPARSPWDKLLRQKKLAQRLIPIFTTDFVRTAWQLRLPDGAEVECVLDLGSIKCNDTELPISEIELELKSGDAASLFCFALTLQKTITLRIGNVSKAARGYTLFAPQTASAEQILPVKFSKRTTVEQSFQQIALHCLMQIQNNEAGVLAGDSAETLHRMRVGLRRLRCAFALYDAVIQIPPGLQRDWDWLATQLGPARDWDVLVDTTLPAMTAAVSHEISLTKVVVAAQRNVTAAHRTAADAVTSARYSRLLLSFMQWISGRGWRDSCDVKARRKMTMPVSPFAHEIRQRQQRRLAERSKNLISGDARQRHRIRISAKNNRYAAEFFQSLYPQRAVRRYIAALSALQDELGRSNDLAIADALLKRLQSQRRELRDGIGYLRGYLASGLGRDNKKLRGLWKTFRSHRMA